jgi:transcription antitermination protein NusB
MANRHLLRTIAMQTLFEWDFAEQKRPIDAIMKVNLEEFAPSIDEADFAFAIARGVEQNREAIDVLVKQWAPHWEIDQMTNVDRNVIRLGVYELKFAGGIVPPKVAINESIELAKTFGGDASGRFVNGVLGAIYKDMLAKGEVAEETHSRKKQSSSRAKKEAPSNEEPTTVDQKSDEGEDTEKKSESS